MYSKIMCYYAADKRCMDFSEIQPENAQKAFGDQTKPDPLGVQIRKVRIRKERGQGREKDRRMKRREGRREGRKGEVWEGKGRGNLAPWLFLKLAPMVYTFQCHSNS